MRARGLDVGAGRGAIAASSPAPLTVVTLDIPVSPSPPLKFVTPGIPVSPSPPPPPPKHTHAPTLPTWRRLPDFHLRGCPATDVRMEQRSKPGTRQRRQELPRRTAHRLQARGEINPGQTWKRCGGIVAAAIPHPPPQMQYRNPQCNTVNPPCNIPPFPK